MRLSLSLVLVLAAAIPSAPAAAVQPTSPATIARRLFVSPAGEPFRRASGAPRPIQAWFEQADTDRDGALTLAEFQADFARYFAVLDTDRDGELEPDEVTRYEYAILPEMRNRMPAGFRSDRGMSNRRSASLAGAAPFGLLPISHPIMDADLDFNRGVSPEEFRQAAARRFALLDAQRTGRLTLAELQQNRRQDYDGDRRDAPGLGREESEPERPRD